MDRCLKKWKLGLVIISVACLPGIMGQQKAYASIQTKIDWDKFLSRHDMVWDRIPSRREVAPYTGNGNVGFLFYQAGGEAQT